MGAVVGNGGPMCGGVADTFAVSDHLFRRVIQPHRLPAHMPGGLAERCSLLCTGSNVERRCAAIIRPAPPCTQAALAGAHWSCEGHTPGPAGRNMAPADPLAAVRAGVPLVGAGDRGGQFCRTDELLERLRARDERD